MNKSSPAALPSSRLALPAWLLSLACHLAALLSLACVLSATTSPVRQEPVRRVGIVLAERTLPQRLSYSREAPAAEATAAEATREDSAKGRGDSGATHGSFLPAADPSAVLIPAIQLPTSTIGGGFPDAVAVPGLTPGRRTVAILPGLGDEQILAEEAARRASRKNLGPPTEVSVFGSAPAVGRSFVFAIDRSKSMGGAGLNALVAARDELTRAVTHLVPQHRFQIIAYNHQCVYFKTPRLIPATDENKAAIAAFIDGLADFGGTGHEMALRAALAMEPDAIFLLTDGGDPHPDTIVQKNIRKLAQGRTTIHCIQFGSGPLSDGEGFLSQLARQNGGGWTYVDLSRRGRS